MSGLQIIDRSAVQDVSYARSTDQCLVNRLVGSVFELRDRARKRCVKRSSPLFRFSGDAISGTGLFVFGHPKNPRSEVHWMAQRQQ